MPVKLGGSSSSYNIHTDPYAPQFTVSYQERIGIWNTNTNNTANTANFYQMCLRRGSVVQCSNLAANTWKQIMSVTGSGFLGTVVFPRLTNNNASTWTIELTIDGVVTERTTPSLGSFSSRRLIFGNITTGPDANNPMVQERAGRAMLGDGYFDNYDGLGGRVVSVGSAYSSVVPADIQMKRGEPVLKFNTNLTVRIKSNNQCLFGGSNEAFAAAIYILNP